MTARLVVVGEVLSENSLEMLLVEHEEMAEALSADRTDHPFDIRGLPGRSEGCAHLVDAHVLYAVGKRGAVDRISIPQEKAWR
ncbi:MAG: hypothetical protein WCI73_04015 [Phycisphaerae bacterium]